MSLLTTAIVSLAPAHKQEIVSPAQFAGVNPLSTAVDSEQIVRERKARVPTAPKGLQLKVVAAENGLPLGDSTIRVVFYGHPYIYSDLATDPEGLATIVLPK